MTAKEASKTAIEYVAELLGVDVQGVRLEEIQAPIGSTDWTITVSLPSEHDWGYPGPRRFKTLQINDVTGDVHSMKIKEFSV